MCITIVGLCYQYHIIDQNKNILSFMSVLTSVFQQDIISNKEKIQYRPMKDSESHVSIIFSSSSFCANCQSNKYVRFKYHERTTSK